MAGLVCYYNSAHYHYLHILGDDFGRRATGKPVRKFLNVISSDSGRYSEALAVPLEITDVDSIHMLADFNGSALQFYFALDSGEWQPIGPVLDGSILSDDYVMQSGTGEVRAAFTGAFFGLCCQDLSGDRLHADFSYFAYKEYL
jgi:xylan 1,4-beta-xylosidase